MAVFSCNRLSLAVVRTLLLTMAIVVGTTNVLSAPSLMTPIIGEKSVSSKFDIRSAATAVVLNRAALANLKKQDEFDFVLPNGTSHTIVFDRIEDHGGGIRSSVGYVKGLGTDYRVIMTTGPAGTFGSIRTPDTSYRVVPGLNGQDLLVDMTEEQKHIPFIDLGNDMRRVPEDVAGAVKTKGLPSTQTSTLDQTIVPGIALASPTPQATIDLMIVYTNGLAARLGSGLMTRLYNLVTAANTAYIDSEVAITLRLVNATMVNYTDLNSDGVALDDVTPMFGGGGGVFSNIETIRTANGADLVAVLRTGSDFGGHGIAWLSSSTPNASYLYSVVTGCVVGCDSVFIHELGHNMGNGHDRATEAYQQGGVANPLPGAYAYSFGHFFCENGLTCNPNLSPVNGGCTTQPQCTTNVANNFGTIMSYFNPSTLKFSNPNVLCQQPGQLAGVTRPCGITETDSVNSANNARSMNDMRNVLAAVKPTQVTTPTGALQFAASSFTGLETNGSVTITVSRVGGSGGSVSVNYATQDGTAKAGFDYTATSGTLTWADGDTADKTFTIALVNDGPTGSVESFTISLSNPTGPPGVFLGVPTTVAVQISDGTPWPPGGTLPAGYTGGVWAVENLSNCAAGQAPCVGSPQVIATTNGVYTFADLNYSGNFTTGIATFDYRVSSLGTPYANLQFLIDGVVAFPSAGGETGWLTAQVPISAGPHTVTWRFRNRINFPCIQASSPMPPPNCQDRAWIDNVVLPEVLNLAVSTTTLTSSVNPSAIAQTVTFTATVSGIAGTPTGFVTFRDAANIIANCNLVVVSFGSAPCITSSLTGGSHSITANYSGNITYDDSASPTLTQNVAQSTVPGAPTIGTAIPGNAQALINFTPPASNGGSPITAYTATCIPGPFPGTAAGSPVTVAGLANNTPYSCSVTATNANNSTGAASATVGVTPQSSAPPALANVFSHKLHGANPFDMGINLTGALSVEPRTIGNGHTIVFHFNNTINSVGGVTVVDSAANTVNATSAPSGSTDVIVTIPSLADNKRITISLGNVMGPSGTLTPQPVSMGFLIGDFNSSRTVNASDISAVKAQSGLPLSQANFKFDVNASGLITPADVAAVKARAGLVLP